VGRLIAGELIKVRTTRTALGFGAASLLLVVAGVTITILAGHPDTIDDKRDALTFGDGISLVVLLFGAVGATGEFRHRTLAPAVLIAPDRLRLLVARVGAYTLTGTALAVVIALVGVTILEPLVGLIKDRLLDYTLGSALTGVAESGSDRLSFGGAILVLLAWTVAMLAAAALVDGRRDVE
jgi:ABC-2 type transport system permease protein